jgi:uncharacterized protein YecT (DUF1311 family)
MAWQRVVKAWMLLPLIMTSGSGDWQPTGVVAAVAAQSPAEAPSADRAHGREDRERALVRAVESLAAAEPLISAVDTRLEAARHWSSRYPSAARELLRNAQTAWAAMRDEMAAGWLGCRLVEAMLVVRPEDAETFALGLPVRGSKTAGNDFKGQAFERIVTHWLNRDRKRTISAIRSGLRSGALRNRYAGAVILQLTRDEPAEARALYAELLAAFGRAAEIDWRDVQFLLECTRGMVGVDNVQTMQGVDAMLRAIERPSFNSATARSKRDQWQAFAGRPGKDQVLLEDGREVALVQIAGLLSSIGPAAMRQYEGRLHGLRAELRPAEAAPALNVDVRAVSPMAAEEIATAIDEMLKGPDRRVEGGAQAPLGVVRSHPDGVVRTWSLIDLAGNSGVGTREGLSLLTEAEREATGLQSRSERIAALRALLLVSTKVPESEALRAGVAGALSVETAAFCRCEEDSCPGPVSEGRLSCLWLHDRLMPAFAAGVPEGMEGLVMDPSIRSRLWLQRGEREAEEGEERMALKDKN